MGRRVALIVSTVVIALLLSAPGYQMLTSLFPPIPLAGVEESSPLPRPSWASLKMGSWQGDAERWFAANIGFRGFFVRTDNQLGYWLFREISPKMGTGIVVGRGDVLFERAYVDVYLKRPTLPDPEVADLVGRLKTLRDRLRDRNVHLLLVISPSKVALCPENLPPRYYRPGVDPSPPVYRHVLPLLQRQGINLVDAPAILESEKRSGTYPVFPRGGTHWSSYGAAVVCDRVGREMEELLGKKLPRVRLTNIRYSPIPEDTDKDLLDLANLWLPQLLYEELPYPRTLRPRDLMRLRDRYQPRVLVVGSSFSYLLVKYLDQFHLCSKLDLYYYFKSFQSLPSGEHGTLDPRKLDWDKDVFSHEVIILEINETILQAAGFGFVDAALQRLR